MLANNIIMHGVCEDVWELDDNRIEKVDKAIACTIDEDYSRKRMKIARSIPIRTTKRIGKYRARSNLPISISFEKKIHADTLFGSKSHLPK